MKRGIEEHKSLKMCYTDGKIMINKQNLFSKAWMYWMNNKSPATMTFAQVMTGLLNDGNQMLSATLLMNSQGQMRRPAAEVYWNLLMGQEMDGEIEGECTRSVGGHQISHLSCPAS